VAEAHQPFAYTPGLRWNTERLSAFQGGHGGLRIWPGMGIEESPGEHFVYPLFCSDDTFGFLVSTLAIYHELATAPDYTKGY